MRRRRLKGFKKKKKKTDEKEMWENDNRVNKAQEVFAVNDVAQIKGADGLAKIFIFF